MTLPSQMEFDAFLKEALTPLGYDWRRHRRRGVRRKVLERARLSGAGGLADYLDLLRVDPAETGLFRTLLGVTISRFYRDPRVFDRIRDDVIPDVLERRGRAQLWSCGAASGEEPYTLALVAAESFPQSEITITATDIDTGCIRRAAEGVYGESSLKDVPEGLKRRWFKRRGGVYVLDREITGRVRYIRHDVLSEPAPGEFDVLLCRNIAYTYFGAALRDMVTLKLHGALAPGGYLVIGRTEALPASAEELFGPAFPGEKIFARNR